MLFERTSESRRQTTAVLISGSFDILHTDAFARRVRYHEMGFGIVRAVQIILLQERNRLLRRCRAVQQQADCRCDLQIGFVGVLIQRSACVFLVRYRNTALSPRRQEADECGRR